MRPLKSTGLALALLLVITLVADGRRPKTNAPQDFTSAAAKQALERYLAEVDAIERVATERKAQARQRLEDALNQTQRAETEPGSRYHGMLGSYHDMKGRIPFILLAVPDGKNVLSTRQKAAMNARGGSVAPLYKFEARGHITIPAKGMYQLITGRGYGEVKLNGISYILNQKKVGQPLTAEVELDQGTYEVYYSVGNNGGQMNYSQLSIVNLKSQKPLPIFVYESDLKNFWHDLTLGVELTEVSGWTMKNHRLD